MDIEKLIQLIKPHVYLYDIHHAKYSDTSLKEIVWQEIGEEMNLDGTECKSKWNSLRCGYRKYLKRHFANNRPTKIKRYRYSDELEFLDEHMRDLKNDDMDEDQKPTVKAENKAMLDGLDDEKLIALVKQYRFLYDMSHAKYMDKFLKDRVWKKIGESLNVDGSACRVRWNNLRCNFRKYVKRASEGKSRLTDCIYTKELKFLMGYFQENTTVNSSLKVKDEDGMEELLEDLMEQDLPKGRVEDEKLIDLVKECPILYDKSHCKYKDTNVKEEVWKEIGKQMNLEGSACKSRWNLLRDCYRKNLKRRLSNTGRGGKYKYEDKLAFLNHFFREIEVEGFDNVNEEYDDFEIDEIQEFDNSMNQTDDENVNFQFESVTDFDEDEVSVDVPLSKIAVEISESKDILQIPEAPELSSSVDAFLAGIAPTLKNLTPYYLNLAKSKIFTTVQKYEMAMLMQEGQAPNQTGRNFFQTDTSTCSSPAHIDSFEMDTPKTNLKRE